MAESNCSMFLEDEVCKNNGNNIYTFGLVLENSEYVSSDEDDDEESTDRLKKGMVKIAWHPEGTETVEEEDKVTLTDRSLMPGDVVRRLIKGKNSPRGFVLDTIVKCHIHIKGTNKYIFNVDSKNLLPLQGYELDPGDVTMDSWVGKLEAVNQKIVLCFPDGAKCEMTDSDLCVLECINADSPQDSEFTSEGCYFKGQVFTGTMDDLREVRWLNQTRLYNPKVVKKRSKKTIYMQVEEAYVNSVEVHWICRGFTKMEDSLHKMEHPPSEIQKKDLNKLFVLSAFNHSSIQIGDKTKYVIKQTDILLESAPKGSVIPDILTWNVCGSEPSIPLPSSPPPSYSEASEMEMKENGELSTHSEDNKDVTMEVDKEVAVNGVENSDDDYGDDEDEDEDDELDNDEEKHSDEDEGKHSGEDEEATKARKARGSVSKKKVCVKKNANFKKASKSGAKHRVKFDKNIVDVSPGSEVAIEVCYTFSCADVMWQNGEEEKGIPSPELFPIHHLDELEFFPGDFVIESTDVCGNNYGVVVSCDHVARTCLVKWMKTVDLTKGEKPDDNVEATEVSVYDIKDHPDFKFRPSQTVIRVAEPNNVSESTPAVGQIYRLDPQGAVFVRWPSEEITRCYPQELYIVGEEMSEFDSDSEWTTEDEDNEEEASDASWETENEEEVEGSDAATPSENKDTEKMWSMLHNKKEELENLLERAQTALSKLEQIFQHAKSVPNPEQCYIDILAIYRKCRDMERLLRSSYFEDPALTDLIDEVRAKLRKVKSNKINKHLFQVFEQRRNQGQSGEATENKSNPPVDCAQPCCEGKQDSPANPDSENQACATETSENVNQDTKDQVLGPDDENIILCSKITKLLRSRMTQFQKEMKEKCSRAVEDKVGEANSNIKQEAVKVTEKTADEILQEETTSRDMEAESSPETSQAQTNEESSQSTCEEADDSIDEIGEAERGFFAVESQVSSRHKFYSKEFDGHSKTFLSAIRKEMKLLHTSLPKGIIVKTYEDRMELFSVMIIGPAKTPYEDAPFFFDVHLPADYPKVPPLFHYISFCTDRLNPNLYEDGNVCVSLLGTWEGKDKENWTSSSNLLQVLVSIQGLILVAEPYYNEAGYERQKGTQQGHENSKTYNEMAVLKLVQSTSRIVKNPPQCFQKEVKDHFGKYGQRFIRRIEHWLSLSEEQNSGCPQERDEGEKSEFSTSDFPLLPASKGFCLTMRKHIAVLKSDLATNSS